MFYCWCFFLFLFARLPPSSLGRSPWNFAIWVRFIMQSLGPSPQRNWGPKTCKIRRDFRKLQTSNFDREYLRKGTRYIQNRKEMCSSAIPPASHERSQVNFCPLTTENDMWVWTHPNWIFRETIFRPLGVLAPQILTRTTDWYNGSKTPRLHSGVTKPAQC